MATAITAQFRSARLLALLHWNCNAGGLAAGLSGLAASESARPPPFLSAVHQTGFHRIFFHIPHNCSELLLSSNPMIKILSLPKNASSPAQQPVRAYSSRGFQPTHD